MSEPLSADIVIVGSGVAGALAAAKLAPSGLKVLILEAGPRIDRDSALERFRDAAIKIPDAPYQETAYAHYPGMLDPDRYYVQAGPDPFRARFLRFVGGTTWHWLGTAPRFQPDDFHIRSKFGVGADWPISYEDLEPYYVEAERELGVAGDAEDDPGSPRSAPFPMPPIPASYLDRQVAAALAGTRHRVQLTPQARNSVVRDGRPACCGAASCVPLCPTRAKYDATVHLARAEQAGARLVDKAVATFVDVADDRRISAIRFKRPDGSIGVATGKVFVIAAHGIETPKLLLISRSDRTPNGVANQSDQVGRNLMDHPTQLSLALAPDPVWSYRGPFVTSNIERISSGPWRRERAAHVVEIYNGGWSWVGKAPITTARNLAAQGLRGAALQRALFDQVSRQILIYSYAEQLPEPGNRIVPAFDKTDVLGIPRPRVSYRFGNYTLRGLAEARAVHDEIFAALRASEIYHEPQPRSGGHIMGTYRMGADPRTSVVDASSRAHDHRNLFLLGSGTFPSGSVANPTLTLAALALSAVDQIRDTTRNAG